MNVTKIKPNPFKELNYFAHFRSSALRRHCNKSNELWKRKRKNHLVLR